MLRVWSIAGLGLVGCSGLAPEAATPCRPANIAPASLGIGPLTFQPGDMEVSVVTGSAGRPALKIMLNEAGTTALAEVTEANVGEPLDLKIDGEVKISPVVQQPILGGRLEVTGYLDRASVEADVERLRPACPLAAE